MKQILISLAILVITMGTAAASDSHRYRVTVTNATGLHVITPPLAVIHRRHFSVFEIGQPATDGLAMMAETGDNSLLFQELTVASGVFNVVATASPVVYGNSLSFEISGPENARISVTGMLATTNDAFMALNGVRLPRHQSSYLVFAYDAGSETNNELCSHIPGPPCGGAQNLRTATGEGFVFISGGVHGVGDLSVADLDWAGPVAKITITRIRGNDDDDDD